MTIELMPTTSLGAAAAKVVETVAAKQAGLPLTKWDGQKIGQPGIYSLPIEFYHGDACVGPSISSSGLRTIESLTPKHFFNDSYLNPNRAPQKQKDAFDFGRAAHTLLLGESGFRDQFVVRPDIWDSWRTNDAKAWKASQIKAGKTVLDSDDIEAIKAIAESLQSDPLVSLGLLNGEIERSLIWQDKETGIWLKSRPDALPVNADIVADLKTTDRADPVSVRRTILDYGYHMQLALVGMGMKELLGRTLGNDDHVLVFVEKKAPFCVNVKPVDIEWIAAGRMQIRRALRTFADCLSKGEWPGWSDNGQTATAPDWFMKRMESEINSGLLPNAEAA
jgi:hypothetical protein